MAAAPDDDAARLARLVHDYGTLIRRAVARVARRNDADLGDEIVQRVTVAIWKQLAGEQTIDRPASYLYRCAVRETVRELRRELASGDPAPLLATPGADTDDPEHAARARELARETERALTAMAPARALAVRAHLLGFAVEEIMTMHGWTYQKARNLIARGTAELRAALATQGYP